MSRYVHQSFINFNVQLVVLYALTFQVVGQWDNKFIIAVIEISEPQQTKVLTLFDQHAADERIQLERILKGNV